MTALMLVTTFVCLPGFAFAIGVAVLSRLFGSSAAKSEPAYPSIETIDADVAQLTADAERIDAEIAAHKGEIEQLTVENAGLSLPAFRGDVTARQRQDLIDGRLDYLHDMISRLETARTTVQQQLSALGQQRTVAIRLQDEAELKQTTTDLQVAGREAHDAFVVATRALERFIAIDAQATQQAYRLGQPEGRWIVDRIGDAMSGYLMPVLWRLAGTEISLNVTSAARHLDFVQAAQRPFSPRAETPVIDEVKP